MGTISRPMQVLAVRFDPEEKARLQQLARDRNVTLSWALREGARLLLEDARNNDLGAHPTRT